VTDRFVGSPVSATACFAPCANAGIKVNGSNNARAASAYAVVPGQIYAAFKFKRAIVNAAVEERYGDYRRALREFNFSERE
jgi:hypothetical protein